MLNETEMAKAMHGRRPVVARDEWRVQRQWTDAERAKIIGLKGTISASVIGGMFGVSRGAICGIWHRASLKERGQ